ncbi:MAG: hypothetical protein MHM6MM_001582 [Cercozoa sp. M6MM]
MSHEDLDSLNWNVVGPSRYTRSRRRAAQLKAQAAQEEGAPTDKDVAATEQAEATKQQSKPESEPVVRSLGEPNKPKPKKKKKKKSKKAKQAMESREGMVSLLESLLRQSPAQTMLMSALSDRVREVTNVRSWNKDLKSKFSTLKNFLEAEDVFTVDGDFVTFVERQQETTPEQPEAAVPEEAAKETSATVTETTESAAAVAPVAADNDNKTSAQKKGSKGSKKGKKGTKSAKAGRRNNSDKTSSTTTTTVNTTAASTGSGSSVTASDSSVEEQELPSSKTANQVMPFMLLGLVLVTAGLVYKKVLLE